MVNLTEYRSKLENQIVGISSVTEQAKILASNVETQPSSGVFKMSSLIIMILVSLV